MAKKKDILKRSQKTHGQSKDLTAKLLEKRLRSEEEGPEPKPKRLNVNLDPGFYDRFKKKCQREDQKMSEVVRDLIEAYLSI